MVFILPALGRCAQFSKASPGMPMLRRLVRRRLDAHGRTAV